MQQVPNRTPPAAHGNTTPRSVWPSGKKLMRSSAPFGRTAPPVATCLCCIEMNVELGAGKGAPSHYTVEPAQELQEYEGCLGIFRN